MTKGTVASDQPIPVDVEEGKAYFWCACGLSKNQPFCDGSHKGSEFNPVKWEAEASGTKWFCACKQTSGQPFCDGSHKALSAPKPRAEKPAVEQRENGPLVIKNVENLTGPDGAALETKPVMALCRCGESGNKPFCDGSHSDAGFTSLNETEKPSGKVYSYEGKDVTVFYNKLLCSHAAECGRLNSAVFDPAQKPWIQPDRGSLESVREVISACPSGALSMKVTGGDPTHEVGDNSEVHVEKNGPYWVRNISIEGTNWAEASAENKYVLCRCGLSKNKPYCDGTHRDERWSDGS